MTPTRYLLYTYFPLDPHITTPPPKAYHHDLLTSMSSLFPLASKVVISLSIVEFLAGLVKSSGGVNKLGITILLLFGGLETICAVLISISVLTRIGLLTYTYSKVLYTLAVVGDIVFLVLDLVTAYLYFLDKQKEASRQHSNADNEAPKLPPMLSDLVGSISILLLTSIPTIIMTVLLFHRLKWSMSAVEITELTPTAYPPPSFWISFSGFVILFSGVLFGWLLAAGRTVWHKWRRGKRKEKGWLLGVNFGFGVFVVFGLFASPLIPSGGLRAPEDLAAGFAFLTLTTIPPFTSFMLTLGKHIMADDSISNELTRYASVSSLVSEPGSVNRERDEEGREHDLI